MPEQKKCETNFFPLIFHGETCFCPFQFSRNSLQCSSVWPTNIAVVQVAHNLRLSSNEFRKFLCTRVQCLRIFHVSVRRWQASCFCVTLHLLNSLRIFLFSLFCSFNIYFFATNDGVMHANLFICVLNVNRAIIDKVASTYHLTSHELRVSV